MQNVLNDIIEAHGGLEYWRTLDSIEIEYSASGLLLAMKGVRPLERVRMSIYTGRPEVVAHDHPGPGETTRWFGDERVEVVDAQGRLRERAQPRKAFGGLRHFFRWDALDFAYFSSYAMWGYLLFPLLFLRDGVKVASETGSDGVTHLAVDFPPSIPAHCRHQDFWFDRELHLLRLDYTAEVVGSWAKAAHFCGEYRRFGGLTVPTRRRVYPKLLFNRPFRLLTLVAIDIHKVVPNASR